MKRLLIAAMLTMAPVWAFGAACATVAGCAVSSSSTGCDANVVGSWSCGNVPTGGDTWSIGSGHTAIIKSGTTFGGTGTISGALVWEESTGWRTAGVGTLTVTCGAGTEITVASGGALRQRMGDRIAFDSTAAACRIECSDGSDCNWRGAVDHTKITAIVASTDHPNCNGSDGVSGGRKYVITLADFPANETDATISGRRILFASGAAMGRQYEIRDSASGTAVATRTVAVCTDYLDSLSGITGQRLTPHANLAVRTRPADLDTMAAPGPVASCTGAGTPANYGGCTGAGTGDIVEALPAVGDRVTIIRDGSIVESTGASGMNIAGPSGGMDPLPTMFAMHIAHNPASTHNDTGSVRFRAKTTGQAIGGGVFGYNNIHDQNHAAPVILEGVQDTEIVGNAIHDDGDAASNTQCGLYLGSQVNTAPDVGLADLDIHLNAVYRTKGNAICPGFCGTDVVTSTGIAVRENLVYQGCVTGTTECRGVEVCAATQPYVHDNMVYDLYADSATGDAFSLGSDVAGGAYQFNYAVNLGGRFIVSAAPAVSFVANYASNMKSGAVSARGRYFSNLFKNGWMLTTDTAGFVVAPDYMAGNMLIPADDTFFPSADCASSKCSRHGVYMDSSLTAAVTMTDNTITGLASNFYGAGVAFMTSDTLVQVNIEHLTYDNRGRNTTGAKHCVYDERDNGGVVALNITDSLCMNNNAQYSFRGATTSHVVTVTNMGVHRSPTTAYNTLAPSNADTETGTIYFAYQPYRSPAALDYTMDAESSLATGGSSPAGSAVGSRAFRFPRQHFRTVWGASAPFNGEQPVDFSNGTCSGLASCNQDTDGDGVMDLHDNCKRVFNPSQYDSNNNGKGNACD